jgi:molybdopterin-guanine dinucleotide biosynthesis protein A
MSQPAATLTEVTGAVLTGGMSKRLGRDKVLLPYGDKPLVAHVHDLLKELFPRVILVGHIRAELDAFGFECVEDIVPEKGVLGGIHTALSVSDTPFVFVAGADMPFLSRSLISEIADHRSKADAVIPRGPRGMEPLCALYSSSCLTTIEQSLERSTLKVMAALEGLTIVSPEIETGQDKADPFANINYPEDLKKLKNSF